jgi:hypothetical protein
MPDITEIFDELSAMIVSRNGELKPTEKRCKHRFSIFPTRLKKFANTHFEHYNSSWFSKIYIFQERFESDQYWHTMAILDKKQAIEYLLER